MKEFKSRYKENDWMVDVIGIYEREYLIRGGHDRDRSVQHNNVYRCTDCLKEWQTLPFNYKDYKVKRHLKAEFLSGFKGIPLRRKKPSKVFCREMCDGS